MNSYLVIDGPSISHAANAGTTLSVGGVQTQAIYGVLRTVQALLKQFPSYKPVVCWDGASWRKLRFPDYKANRDKADTQHEKALQIQKEGLKKQLPAIRKGLELLGVPQLSAINMEADDLAAIFVDRNTDAQIFLISADRDWIQLVGPRVAWFDPINDRRIHEKDLELKYGVKTVRQFIELKALMGDAGDNVPGVGGIGEKGAVEFLQKYGSFADFMNMVTLEKTIDIKTLHKKYRNLVEDEQKAVQFLLNLELMDLRHPQRPDPINFQINKGTPSAERFEAFCNKLMFRSITKSLEHWLSVFPAFATIAADPTALVRTAA